MSFDEELAARVREKLSARASVAERKMFGGLAFMVGGHMCCGVLGPDLMVRVGPAAHETALAEPGARPMDFTGKPLKGMVYVSPAGLQAATALEGWIERGLAHVDGLPPKAPAGARAARGRARGKAPKSRA